MEIINKIPEVPEVITCEKHGEFEARYLSYFGTGRFMVIKQCAKCAEDQKIEQVEKERDDQQRKERQWARDRRLNAGITERNIGKSFEDYRTETEKQKYALEKCRQFTAAVSRGEQKASMILAGKVGTGKTLLANAMIESLVDTKQCRIVRVINLIRRLKETWSRESEQTETDVIDWYVGLDLLIIDEVGVQFGSDTERMFIFDIIDGRYNAMKPTVIISNLDVNGIKEVIGERAIDRLREDGGKLIAFDWESQRK